MGQSSLHARSQHVLHRLDVSLSLSLLPIKWGKMVVDHGLIMCEQKYLAKIIVHLKSRLRDYFTTADLF
jgi:hypothetical protein